MVCNIQHTSFCHDRIEQVPVCVTGNASELAKWSIAGLGSRARTGEYRELHKMVSKVLAHCTGQGVQVGHRRSMNNINYDKNK